jgi:hypothetical protein
LIRGFLIKVAFRGYLYCFKKYKKPVEIYQLQGAEIAEAKRLRGGVAPQSALDALGLFKFLQK